MIAAAARNVMQDRRIITCAIYFVHNRSPTGGHLLKIRSDPAQDADRTDRMLVRRVDVIHIVLHLRHNASKIAHEISEHTAHSSAAMSSQDLCPKSAYDEGIRIGSCCTAFVIRPRLRVIRCNAFGWISSSCR